MIKRTVRLKQQPAGIDDILVPPDIYIEKTDGSLAQVGYRRRTTTDGYLETGVEVVPGRPTLFVLGGSFVESMYCPESERFVSRLAQDSGWNVLNGGYSGMTTLQLVVAVLSKIAGQAKEGDCLLAFVPLSDINPLLKQGSYWLSDSTYTAIQPALGSELEPSTTHLSALLKCMESFTRHMGLKMILGVSPLRDCAFDQAWIRNLYRRNSLAFSNARRVAGEINETVRREAHELGLDILDVDAYLEGNPNFFYDELHLNQNGQAEVARFASERLRTVLSDW